jgi:uncharacterized protein YndB with AHSA1/START domain
MKAPVQGSDELVIDASCEEVWAILEDSTRLPEWTTVTWTTGTREIPGSVRECGVDFEGKTGTVVERCAEYDPGRRIAWNMEQDSLGFSRMLSDFGFSFTLTPAEGGRTLVFNETYYRPATLLARAINSMVMRRKFRSARRRFLGGLKRLAEADREGAFLPSTR